MSGSSVNEVLQDLISAFVPPANQGVMLAGCVVSLWFLAAFLVSNYFRLVGICAMFFRECELPKGLDYYVRSFTG